ncbi:hypothetical protein SPLA10_PHROGS00181 [Salmonella phage SPLA10]|nr:hypothetical protein SPLA10_PHROGS00181 [Salmonella phage SPLA10]
MSKLAEEVLAIADEGMASIDASHIVLQEQQRLSLTEDMSSLTLSPMTVMFWALADYLATDSIDAIVVDGTEATWQMHLRRDGKIETRTTQQLIDHPQPPEEHLKGKLGVIIPAYYLLRFYQLAGVSKYAITKQHGGLVIAVNDPANPRVWAAHKVE